MPKFLAIDLGAESGRMVLADLNGAALETQEVRRFPNDPVRCHGLLHWDVLRLWHEIQLGLEGVRGTKLASVAVDTWAIDYALLGENGELLANPLHYRNQNSKAVMEDVFRRVPRNEIYNTTGIQFMPINTLYQLWAHVQRSPKLFASAERLITIPDLFHFWLSGTAVCEFTNASTTQMLDARTRKWADGMLQRLNLPTDILGDIVEPCTVLGKTKNGTPVVAPASHDTASAVAAVEARDGVAFLSSGTWSLVGAEIDSPVINADAMRLNFTNEGGICGTTRLLKNVMGLWLLQGCRKAFARRGSNISYEELAQSAQSAPAFRTILDPDHISFLQPDCMVDAIDRYCDENSQPKPRSEAEYARAVLESLALRYRTVLDELEELTGTRIDTLRIIGGGSRNNVLNQWTANATGRRVLAGPVEATALGNIAAQMLATGVAKSIGECREIIARAHPPTVFEPRDTATWERYLCHKQSV